MKDFHPVSPCTAFYFHVVGAAAAGPCEGGGVVGHGVGHQGCGFFTTASRSRLICKCCIGQEGLLGTGCSVSTGTTLCINILAK